MDIIEASNQKDWIGTVKNYKWLSSGSVFEGVEGSRVLKMSSKGGIKFLEKELMNCAS